MLGFNLSTGSAYFRAYMGRFMQKNMVLCYSLALEAVSFIIYTDTVTLFTRAL
jgi:hypothetical protein